MLEREVRRTTSKAKPKAVASRVQKMTQEERKRAAREKASFKKGDEPDSAVKKRRTAAGNVEASPGKPRQETAKPKRKEASSEESSEEDSSSGCNVFGGVEREQDPEMEKKRRQKMKEILDAELGDSDDDGSDDSDDSDDLHPEDRKNIAKKKDVGSAVSGSDDSDDSAGLHPDHRKNIAKKKALLTYNANSAGGAGDRAKRLAVPYPGAEGNGTAGEEGGEEVGQAYRGEGASLPEKSSPVKRVAEKALRREKFVKEANSTRTEPERDRRTIFVGNVPAGPPQHRVKKALHKMFDQFGQIESLRFRSVLGLIA
ncbi:hypothetical protein T484DRAFT_1825216 [Baffinella frigidus]|nr:hypothetical protein T484DRAFT_1825216 [Cryptophyta sp. CCMP2293]